MWSTVETKGHYLVDARLLSWGEPVMDELRIYYKVDAVNLGQLFSLHNLRICGYRGS